MSSNGQIMRKGFTYSAPLLLLTSGIVLLAATGAQTQSFNFRDLLGGILPTIVENIYATEDMELFGYPCQYTRSPYFKRFELQYRATVRCPGWTPIQGKAKDHSSSNGAEIAATKDFVRQVVEAGLVTEEEAKNWL